MKKKTREIQIATQDRLHTTQAEIITKEINGNSFEFGIHPAVKDNVFQTDLFAISEVRTGLFLWESKTRQGLRRRLDEWLEKADHKAVEKLIMGHPPVEDLPEIYEHKKIEQIQRKEWWQELAQIFKFTPKLDGLVSITKNEISLDIIWLDKRLNCPDGVSLKDHIKNTYGARAEELVSKLI